MSMQSLYGHLIQTRRSGPLLPQHKLKESRSNDFALDDLGRRSAPTVMDDEFPQSWTPESTPGSFKALTSSELSPVTSTIRPHASFADAIIFSNPPPPIAPSAASQSRILYNSSSRPVTGHKFSQESSSSQTRSDTRLTGNYVPYRWETRAVDSENDSAWWDLRRREESLREEAQRLLDLQASSLLSGIGDHAEALNVQLSASSDLSSTMTGTFYTTATSPSTQLSTSQHPITLPFAENLMPVRQPRIAHRPGLRSARHGLRKLMSLLGDLKSEEDMRICSGITQRKQALQHLKNLIAQRDGLNTDLQSLAGGEEETTTKQLHNVNLELDDMSSRIAQLQAEIDNLRYNQKTLREKKDEIISQHESELSGYRGALKVVDAKINSLMECPPIRPLNRLLYTRESDHAQTSSGRDFLNLNRKRRMPTMAVNWWKDELGILENQRSEVRAEREALDEGRDQWTGVMNLVSEFEAGLRTTMLRDDSPDSRQGALPYSTDDFALNENVRQQLARMNDVINQLEYHMHHAAEKRWNLLVCAIGAELEAFKEAQSMLKEALEDATQDQPREIESPTDATTPVDPSTIPDWGTRSAHPVAEDSDNEVPPAFLVSQSDYGGDDVASQDPNTSQRLKELDHSTIHP